MMDPSGLALLDLDALNGLNDLGKSTILLCLLTQRTWR